MNLQVPTNALKPRVLRVRSHLNYYQYQAINAASKLFKDLARRVSYRDRAGWRELSETQRQISRGRGGSAPGANEGGCETCERQGR